MKKDKQERTNAMRQLDQAGISYESLCYAYDESDLSGKHAAAYLGISPEEMFKTLVTRDANDGYYVFLIPVAGELDFRKAAKAAGVKKIEMLHVKELFGLTGYVRGGCSPIGMKKAFPTYIDETAMLYEQIYLSAGKRGLQIKMDPEELARFIHADFADVAV